MGPQEEKLDVLVITALQEEAIWIEKLFAEKWEELSRQGQVVRRALFPCGGGELHVGLVSQLHMGMPYAAVTATKAILQWDPKLVAMTGICAGVEGKVGLGDLVIANQTFDYGSGKIIGGKLHPHLVPVSINPWLWQVLDRVLARDELAQAILDGFPGPGESPANPPQLHFASMGTGAAVVCDADYVEEVTQEDQKLCGLDMEGYAVALAASLAGTHGKEYPCFVIKAVVDFASIHKNDQYHDYAAYASAAFLKRFLEDPLTSEIFE